MYENSALTIKEWAEEDRPREKLLHLGRNHLSDAELLTILIGTGYRGGSAYDLARQMLARYTNNLHELGKCTVDELTHFKGIGEAKAITLVAAFELGRRRRLSEAKDRPVITGSQAAFEVLEPRMADLGHEEFWVLLLNRANKVLKAERISSGGMTGTVVDAKLVFQAALQARCASIILSHNHPSGSIRPSQADIQLTKKLKSAGELLDIRVLDHLIIGEKNYYSFADEGLI